MSWPFSLCATLCLVLAGPGIVFAQPVDPVSRGGYTMSRTEVLSWRAEGTPEYRLSVALPAAYESSRDAFPVVYLLDGDWYFGLTAQTLRLLEAVGELPPVILVAIGFGDTLQEQRSGRVRDFTPKADPTLGGSGHAGAFLLALERHLIPTIERRYRTTRDRTLVGHSLGGLFATFAIARAPGLFTRVIIGSPAMRSSGPSLLQEIKGLGKEGQKLPERIFLGLAAGDWAAIRDNYAAWRSALQSTSAGIRWTAEEFAATTHQSVVPSLIARGLAWAFAR